MSFYFNLHDVHNLHSPICFVLYVMVKQTKQAFLLLKIQVLNHCFSSTIFLSVVTLRQSLKNKNRLRT